jgi:hypothetical protein
VPSLPKKQREKVTINNTFESIQSENLYEVWLEIDRCPINKFQTIRYIVHAFPTFYPTGRANLHAEYVKNIKPVEYLMWYKDGRFA